MEEAMISHRIIALSDLLPNAGELRQAAYSSTSGDPATDEFGIHSRRNLHQTDTEGRTKKQTWWDATMRNMGWFNDIASRTKATPFNFPPSQRTYVPKDDGGSRPIDDPCEAKRLVSLVVREKIEARIEQFLLPSQLGGRRFTKNGELDHLLSHRGCNVPGANVIDHFATLARQNLWDGYHWVVSIDLKNAFGLLPRSAVVTPLQNLGFPEEAIEFLWRLVRIDSIDRSSGQKLESYDLGIEQGNPLSALILNLALSRPLSKLQKRYDIRTLTFVDDIYLFSRSESEAHRVFQSFRAMLKNKGFQNVRPLKKAGENRRKASKIINVKEEPLTILKVYEVTPQFIGPSVKGLELLKSELLRNGLSGNLTLEQIRRGGNLRAISKRWIRDSGIRNFSKRESLLKCSSLLDLTVSLLSIMEKERKQRITFSTFGVEKDIPERDSSPKEMPTEKTVVMGTSIEKKQEVNVNSVLGKVVQGHLEKKKYDGPLIHYTEVLSIPIQNGNDEHVLHLRYGADKDSTSVGSRRTQKEQVGSARNSAHSSTGGNSSVKMGRGQNSQPAVPSPVLSVTDPEVTERLKKGLRVGVNDNYKPAISQTVAMCDLTGIEDILDYEANPSRFSDAVRSCLRTCRSRNQVLVRFDPRQSYAGCQDLFGNSKDTIYRRTKMMWEDEAVVYELTKENRRKTMNSKTKEAAGAIPKAELTILGVRCRDRSTNHYRITFRLRDEPVEHLEKVAKSRNRSIAKVEVATELLNYVPHLSAVIPADNMLTSLLLGNQRGATNTSPKQVALNLAQTTLLHHRTWALSADGGWLLGTPKRPIRDDAE